MLGLEVTLISIHNSGQMFTQPNDRGVRKYQMEESHKDLVSSINNYPK